MSSARETAGAVLAAFDAGKGPLRPILDEAFQQAPALAARDRAFCRDLVYGAVRRLNTVDWALGRFAREPLEKLHPPVRAALRLGAYQILYMADRVPAYAAVSESVDFVKRHAPAGAVSFANGVLRSLERGKKSLPWPDEASDPVQSLALRHSHPAWLVRRWLDRWGREECEALLAKGNEAPPLSVRVNALAHTRASLVRAILSEGAPVALSRQSLDGLRFPAWPSLWDLESFRGGGFSVQDESSQLAVHLLDPQPGETALDLCAGVGGKATHIAERMANRGAVLAFDVSAPRLHLLKENAARLGARILQPFLMDAREAGKRYMGTADRVLVDAPCSGLGAIRRRPDLRWNKDYKEVLAAMPPLQGELLRSAALCLKPGAVLVYATCTTEPEENEDVVRRFLEERTDFTVESPRPYLPSLLGDAVTPEGYVRLSPHRHDVDGFFIARLRRAA